MLQEFQHGVILPEAGAKNFARRKSIQTHIYTYSVCACACALTRKKTDLAKSIMKIICVIINEK